VVVYVAQLVAALIKVHGLLSFLSDVYGLFDPSGKTGTRQVRCNLQVTLCDPYLSALSVRYYKSALYKYTYLYLYLLKCSDQTRKQRDSLQRPMVIIPYVENISEAVARILRKHNIPVAMKPYKTLKTVLVHPKNKQEKEDLTECVGKCIYIARFL